MREIMRRENEGLVIGEISVTVLEIFEDHVRLAISWPRNTPSYWEQIVYCNNPHAETPELELSHSSDA